MRKAGLFVALLLVLSSSAFGQQKNGVSIFVNDLGYASSAHMSGWSGGAGIAFDRFFTPRVSAQLSIAAEKHRSYPYVVEASGAITPVALHTYPIELTARYHFINDTRWKPFLGAGLHYVGAPNVDPRFGYQNHLTAEASGGFVFQLGRSFGLLLEGKQLLGDRDPYDPLFRAAVGVHWRF